MSLGRIWALVLQELYITRHSLEVIMDTVIYPSLTTIVFGFVASYLAGQNNAKASAYIFLGILLWNVIQEVQYSVTVFSLWNVWSRNLSNLFIAPLSVPEFISAMLLLSAIKGFVIVGFLALIVYSVFGFNLLELGPINIILFFLNLAMFGWSTGIAVLGLIFRVGTKIQALAWGLIFLFQPVSAVYYPVSVLPEALRAIAYALPTTYVFEAARASYFGGGVQWGAMGISFALNLAYLAVSVWFFNVMFRKSKESGQFARNES